MYYQHAKEKASWAPNIISYFLAFSSVPLFTLGLLLVFFTIVPYIAPFPWSIGEVKDDFWSVADRVCG